MMHFKQRQMKYFRSKLDKRFYLTGYTIDVNNETMPLFDKGIARPLMVVETTMKVVLEFSTEKAIKFDAIRLAQIKDLTKLLSSDNVIKPRQARRSAAKTKNDNAK